MGIKIIICLLILLVLAIGIITCINYVKETSSETIKIGIPNGTKIIKTGSGLRIIKLPEQIN